MDELIAVEEIQFDSPATFAENAVEVNAEKYRKYLAINPIWNYLGLSKQEYSKLSVNERKSHIQKYYQHMYDGKKISFLFFV